MASGSTISGMPTWSQAARSALTLRRHWRCRSGWSGSSSRLTTTQAASNRTAMPTASSTMWLNATRGSSAAYTFARSARSTSAGLAGPGMSCRWRAWPGESWMASGLASTRVRTTAAMSSMPVRNAASLTKPWSTATSKQRPSAANRRLSLGSMAPVLADPPGPPPARRIYILSVRDDLEHVVLDIEVRVGLDDLGERLAVVDAEQRADRGQRRVIRVEEPVAVAQRLELLAPHRPLQL